MLAGLVYAVAMPFVGIATTYVYYDTLVRERLDETARGQGVAGGDLTSSRRA